MKIFLPILFLLSGCAAFQPYVNVTRESYNVGVTGTWFAVGEELSRLVEPDKETLAK